MSAPHPAVVDPVTAYARRVVDGEIPAGQWHKASCARHLRDLETADAQGLTWRPELGQKVVLFALLCRHFKGPLAGQPIHLEPWEVFIIGSLFGWVRTVDGLRRFNNAFIELPRGQGKSTLAAIVALYMTFFDNEPGAEGYCFATKKDQAKVVLRTARRFVIKSKALRRRIEPFKYNLHDEDTESKLEILGSDSDNQDGLRPHVAIADEVHRQKTRDMIDVVESGMGTRLQPLMFEITTAGENPESVYEHHFNISTQALDGTGDVPEWFAFIASADPKDDPASEETWRKANPNYGISVRPEFLRKEMRKAIVDPTEWPKFRRLYLGQKVAAADSYFRVEDWDACTTPMLSDDVLRQFPCFMGLDLSSRIDITAAVTVWLLQGEKVGLPAGEWLVLQPRLWVPGENAEERRRKDRVPYPTWIERGFIEGTEGNVIDQLVMREHVEAQKAVWPLFGECAYDPWNAGELALRLDEKGVTMVEARQGPRTMSEPTKRIKELLLQHRIIHGGNDALRWMFSNVRVREDSNGNVAPDKKRSRGRIDGAVASVMGAWRATLTSGPKKQSKYESQDVLRVGGSRAS